ncbi:MAG: hypothetical protein PHI48_02015 [Bacteroidales bacterium]|nr:hypothetical protein [Bacteroidales bacterium]
MPIFGAKLHKTMDSFGDWGYLIMTVVVLLISILGKKPKKEQASELPKKQEKMPQRSIFQSIDKVLSEVRELSTDVKEWNYEVRDERPVVHKKTISPQFVSPSKSNHSSVSAFTHSSELSKESPAEMSKETTTSEPIFSFTDLDDMKKAVIYSEILNRKYIY